jgi:hypothetical protein
MPRDYRFSDRVLTLRFFRPDELCEDPIVPGRMETLRQHHAAHGACERPVQDGAPRAPAKAIYSGSVVGSCVTVLTCRSRACSSTLLAQYLPRRRVSPGHGARPSRSSFVVSRPCRRRRGASHSTRRCRSPSTARETWKWTCVPGPRRQPETSITDESSWRGSAAGVGLDTVVRNQPVSAFSPKIAPAQRAHAADHAFQTPKSAPGERRCASAARPNGVPMPAPRMADLLAASRRRGSARTRARLTSMRSGRATGFAGDLAKPLL